MWLMKAHEKGSKNYFYIFFQVGQIIQHDSSPFRSKMDRQAIPHAKAQVLALHARAAIWFDLTGGP